VEVTRADAEPQLKALAGAILLRSGYALLPKEIESASTTLHADVVGSTEQGFDLILQVYHDFSGEHKSFFDDIAHICGFADLSRDLANAETKKGIKKRIDYFRQLWECNNIHLEQLSQPEEILAILDRALAKAFPSESTPWKRGLLAELEHDRTRLKALRQIGGERVSRWSIEERRFLLAVWCLSYRLTESLGSRTSPPALSCISKIEARTHSSGRSNRRIARPALPTIIVFPDIASFHFFFRYADTKQHLLLYQYLSRRFAGNGLP
jgi:hypothetical protein